MTSRRAVGWALVGGVIAAAGWRIIGPWHNVQSWLNLGVTILGGSK